MGTFLCDVLTAYSSQATLMGYPEHCSADPEKLAAIGRSLGHQVRVVRPSNGNKAIYTVSELRQESPDRRLRMCLDGRKRLSADGSTFSSGTCDSSCVRSNLTDAEAEEQGELVERLDESGIGSALVALAPHGGAIESYTDEQAERVLSQLVAAGKAAACWRCKGWRVGGGAYDAWHITSTEIHPASFPLLDSIKDSGYAYSVAFHGYGEDSVAVGGAAPLSLKTEVADAIQAVLGGEHLVEVVTSGPYAGADPNNLCNWLVATGAGIQIEQPLVVRSGHWQAVADAVATVFAAKL
jgi:phage replication-related protein YjqB (UPF0714/DUF867 family)